MFPRTNVLFLILVLLSACAPVSAQSEDFDFVVVPEIPEGQSPEPTLVPAEVLIPDEQESFGLLYNHGDRGIPYVALTFDLCSGENRYLDMSVVNVLKAYQVPATFFVSGAFAVANETDIKNNLVDPLFEIEGHSWDHPNNGSDLYNQGQYDLGLQVKTTNDVLYGITGQMPRYIRLPAGNGGGYDSKGIWVGREIINWNFITDIGQYRTNVLGWDVVSGDPHFGSLSEQERQDLAARVANSVLSQVQNGSVVVMHANGNGPATGLALETIIPELRNRGFILVTVNQMNLIPEVP